MTESKLETEELAAPQNWIEEVCDALNISRQKMQAVRPSVAELVHTVADSPGDQDDAPLTAFLIGFAAAKDGDFSPEAVQGRVKVVAEVLKNH